MGIESYGGPWTSQKLKILRSYLDAYTTVLKNQPFQLIYIDAFAGPGWRKDKLIYTNEYDDFRKLHKGSPRIAIETNNRLFDKLIFIEKDPDKIKELNKLKLTFNNRNIEIIQGDANSEITKICEGFRAKDRAVVFLDPFATEVDWNTVKCIAKTQRVDCWILFPLMAITRMMSKDRQHSPAIDSQLDRIFGGKEWEALYKDSPQMSLLYDQPEQERAHYDKIADLYREGLKKIFAKVAPTKRAFCNSTGFKMFELFFAVSNPSPKASGKAIEIADHILKRW